MRTRGPAQRTGCQGKHRWEAGGTFLRLTGGTAQRPEHRPPFTLQEDEEVGLGDASGGHGRDVEELAVVRSMAFSLICAVRGQVLHLSTAEMFQTHRT